MRREVPHPPESRHPAPVAGPGLHLCRRCEQPFVVPAAVLGVVGDDRYLVELQCNNCGLVVVSTHDDELLEAFDRELDRQTAHMHHELEQWRVERRLEEIEVFAAALDGDHLLPEDF